MCFAEAKGITRRTLLVMWGIPLASALQGTAVQGTDVQGTDVHGTNAQGTDVQGPDVQDTARSQPC